MEEIFKEGQEEKIRDFLSQKAPRKLLVYHGDSDGVTSAAMFLRAFPGFEFAPRKGPIMGDDFVRLILNKKPELLVFLDLPVDQQPDKLERFLKEASGMKIVILDHHIAEKDLSSERIVHVNPRFIRRDAYIPAACMIYRLLESLGKEDKSQIWIAAMGTIGDYGLIDCKELLDEAKGEYPFLMQGDHLRKSKLGYGAAMIDAAATIKGLNGIGKCLKVLLKAEGFEDFESDNRLKEWKGELDNEFESIIHSFEEEKEEYEKENLVVFEIKSPLSITSMVATHLATEDPERVIVIRKRMGNQWKASLRKQSGGINLGDIVKRCVKGIGSGGGHEKAAAGIVSDWDLFLKRLRKELS